MEKKSELQILLLFLLSFTAVIFINTVLLNLMNYDNQEKKNYDLSPNGYHSIDPFFINDSDPLNNWAQFKIKNPWIEGSGNKNEPYIIKNVKINCTEHNYGVRIFNSHKYIILDNFTIYSSFPSYTIGILLSNSSNIEITNSSFSGFFFEASNAILLRDSNDNLINNNIIDGTSIGISLTNSSKNNILDNEVKGLIDYAIRIESNSNLNNISFNKLGKDGIIAIYLADSRFNLISQNSISSNNEGISLHNQANDNSIIRNRIIKNQYEQIILSNSHRNIVRYNYIIGNHTCIRELNSSSSNIIEYNAKHWSDLPPIFIDDQDPNYTWEVIEKNYEWCFKEGDYYVIENVSIKNRFETAIEIKNSYRDFILRNNNISNCGHAFSDGALRLSGMQKAKIFNNIISNNQNYGIIAGRISYSEIIGNTVQKNQLGGMIIDTSESVIISDNVVTDNKYGIYFFRTALSNQINDNKILSNQEYGITFQVDDLFTNSWRNEIHGNVIELNKIGLNLYYSDNNSIIGNKISNNNETGIVFELSNQNKIWSNNITMNRKKGAIFKNTRWNYIAGNEITDSIDGFELIDSNNNTIVENIVKNNLEDGLIINDSHRNNITKNRFESNQQIGISLIGQSTANIIYENDFISNGINAKTYLEPLRIADYFRDYADTGVVSYHGEYWGTGDYRYPGTGVPWDHGHFEWNENYRYFDFEYLWIESPQYYDLPLTMRMKWGGYQDFLLEEHQYLDNIELNFRIQYAQDYVSVNLRKRDLAITLYDDLGNSEYIIIDEDLGSYPSIPSSLILDSGEIYDRVKDGGYIKYLEISMDCGSTYPYSYNQWLLVDYFNINYHCEENCINYWSHNGIGNFWDDYEGFDLNDDLIGDDPYFITGNTGDKDQFPIFHDKYEVFLDIIPEDLDCYIGEDQGFYMNLTDYWANPLYLPITITAEQGIWDQYEEASYFDLSLFNFSGQIYHNISGTISNSEEAIPGVSAFNILDQSLFPDHRLVITPEILEFNPITNFTKQKIETYIEFDVDYLIQHYNLNSIDLLQNIETTIFGSNFLEVDQITRIENFESKIEVYDYMQDQFFLQSDYYHEGALRIANPTALNELETYTLNFNAEEIQKYISLQNKITLKLSSYFQGVLDNPNSTYLSNFQPRAVIGSLLDFFEIKATWHKENPQKVIKTETYHRHSGEYFNYNPTSPGSYNITFATDLNTNYKNITRTITVDVLRRPTNISLDLPSSGLSTELWTIRAYVSDLLTGTPAIDAEVNFYSNVSGYISGSFTDSQGIATLIIDKLSAQDYKFYAEVSTDLYWDESVSKIHKVTTMKSGVSLELVPLAPEGNKVYVGQEFYILPKLIDLVTGKQIQNLDIELFYESENYGIYKSGQAFLFTVPEPGISNLTGIFDENNYYINTRSELLFDSIRLSLSIIDISPQNYILSPNQQINITVSAKDLALNLQPIEDLTIKLVNNISGFLFEGETDYNGLITFKVNISEEWASKSIKFTVSNIPQSGVYLQHSVVFEKLLRPYNTSIILNTNATNLYVNNFYDLSVSILNLDTRESIDHQPVSLIIEKEGLIDYISFNTSEILTYQFLYSGTYEILVNYDGTDLYLASSKEFIIEIQKRPTMINIICSDAQLVPGNEFSLKVELIDKLTNKSILGKFITIYESIYVNGSIVESKLPFEVYTGVNHTFGWTPLRPAEFHFEFKFDYDNIYSDDIYDKSNTTIQKNIEKRQVFIDSIINSELYNIEDNVEINSTFYDLNSTDFNFIPNLTVHYLIQHQNTTLFSEYLISNSEGEIFFDWQIPSTFINTSFTITIITARTNYYEWNAVRYVIKTSPMPSLFNITKISVNSGNFVDDIFKFKIDLLNAKGDFIKELISYKIVGLDGLIYDHGSLDLEISSLLSISFNQVEIYTLSFQYNGSSIYLPTKFSKTLEIKLRTTDLELIEYPKTINHPDQIIYLTYLLRDKLSLEPISTSHIQLSYINVETYSKISLGIEKITDINGLASFNFTLPENYNFSNLIIYAHALETESHLSTENTLEIMISKSPTNIRVKTPGDKNHFFLGETASLRFNLFDEYNNPIYNHFLNITLLTPSIYQNYILETNSTLDLEFTELGLHYILVQFNGTNLYHEFTEEILLVISPIPTNLQFIEPIPTVGYQNTTIFLKTQLNNNLTGTFLEGQLISFYLLINNQKILLYEDITNSNGIASYEWNIGSEYIDSYIELYAVYNYVSNYENSTTNKREIFISKYDVDLEILDLPDHFSPLIDELFSLRMFKTQLGSEATNCHVQFILELPNGSSYLLMDTYTDQNGLINFVYIPERFLFDFNSVNLQIYAIENAIYKGGLIQTRNIDIEKLDTFITIHTDKLIVLPGESVSITFGLDNIFNETLIGHFLSVEIKNILFSDNFTIMMGENNTLNFTIPNSGSFRVQAYFEGTERLEASFKERTIFSERFTIKLDLNIVESYENDTKCGQLGGYWSYVLKPCQNILTLVANASILDFGMPATHLNISYYYIGRFNDPVLLGSNITDENGIAILKLNLTNLRIPYGKSFAIYAQSNETEIYKSAKTEPIYFSHRKIFTHIKLESTTQRFRIGVPYRINISLLDEFGFKLFNQNIQIRIYGPNRQLIKRLDLITNESSHFKFLPEILGKYKIKVYFEGDDSFRKTHEIECYKCVEKEPTKLSIIVPDYIQPGITYEISVYLRNSTGAQIIGETIYLKIMYHEDSGKTSYFKTWIITGHNNTFSWIFPESDEFIIRASYLGSEDYQRTSTFKLSHRLVGFQFSFLEILFFILSPCIVLSPSIGMKKISPKKKKKFLALIALAVFLGANYASIGNVCGVFESTGLIGSFNVDTTFKPEDPFTSHNQDLFDDALDYTTNKMSSIDVNDIPNLEDGFTPYDIITPNASIIPTTMDKNPPYLQFLDLSDDDWIFGNREIYIDAFDRETGIRYIEFKLLYQGINLVEEGLFQYSNSTRNHNYTLNTLSHQDGEYKIYAIAYDLNNNTRSISVSVHIKNTPEQNFGEPQLEYITTELTDSIYINLTSLVDGVYVINIINKKSDIIQSTEDTISKDQTKEIEIPIDPILFSSGIYQIAIIIFKMTGMGFYEKERREMILQIRKESVTLELDIIKADEIYSDHYVRLRARLLENDFILDKDGNPIADETSKPLKGQVLTFEIADEKNHFILGNNITDPNGYATFLFNMSLIKGLHLFNVTYGGTNIYSKLEVSKIFENKGVYSDILLNYVSSSVKYNTYATIEASLLGDNSPIGDRTLYFNISNTEENYYIGMASTDLNGKASIHFPCKYDPGEYNIIVSYDGDSYNSQNIIEFPNSLIITHQETEVAIETDLNKKIRAPYYAETQIIAEVKIKSTELGIKDLSIIFELIRSGTYHQIGAVKTDLNGKAAILFNPSNYGDILPLNYTLNVRFDGDNYYNASEGRVNLEIIKDLPTLHIQGTEALFYEKFSINATLTDSLLNPLNNEEIHFDIINGSNKEVLYSANATTNVYGIATITVPEGKFLYSGTFDIRANFYGNTYQNGIVQYLANSLTILTNPTELIIQGPITGSAIETLNYTITLVDIDGNPIANQSVKIECYKENTNYNIFDPTTKIITNQNGIARYSFTLAIPGTFELHVIYRPLRDNTKSNDGYLSSKSKFFFEIKRAPAELSIKQMNLPKIMRGNTFEFIVESGLEQAKNYKIPVNVYVNGNCFERFHLFDGAYRFIENGKSIISYTIPTTSLFQAGQYNFSIVIDSRWSIFTGEISFLIDLVERTSLSIKYHILKTKAHGNHYLWEKERIEFTLLDEDKQPLIDSISLLNGTPLNVDRYIRYQITNGKCIDSTLLVDLTNGKKSIYHTPTLAGLETTSVFYHGSRFFTPEVCRKTVQILKRPLVLNFLDFFHNNLDRINLPHTGHRGENLIIIASVQDYINNSYLSDHIVQYGSNGRYYRNYLNKTDGNGLLHLKIPISRLTGLKQAGDYDLDLRILSTQSYQYIHDRHSDQLHIFEYCTIDINVADIIIQDFKYLLKPTIELIDEDGEVVEDTEFLTKIYKKGANGNVFDEFIVSQSFEVAVLRSGVYKIEVSLSEEESAKSDQYYELASNFRSNKYLFYFTQDQATVEDSTIEDFIIPGISHVLEDALRLSLNWEAEIATVTILLVLNMLMTPLGRNIDSTWGMLLEIVLLSFAMGLFKQMDEYYYNFYKHLGVLSGLLMIYSILSSENWLLKVIGLIGGLGILIYTIKTKGPSKAKLDAQRDLESQGLTKKIDIKLILLELVILFTAALIELTKNIWGPLKPFMGVIPIHLWLAYHSFYPIAILLGLAKTILLVIVFAVVSAIIDQIIYIFIPYHKPTEWIRSPVRKAIEWCFIAVLWLSAAYLCGMWVSIFIEVGKAFVNLAIGFAVGVAMGYIAESQIDAVYDFYSGLR